MSDTMNVIANIHGDEKVGLVPYRMVVPSWLPKTAAVAVRMINDISEEYCSNAWVMDGEWVSDIVKSALNTMDWGKAQVLEYDWDAKDSWGDTTHRPFQIWQDCGDKCRSSEIENFIYDDDRYAERYAKILDKDAWQEWTAEEVMRNPCWLFYYAKNVCRGKLPEVLHNAMTMKSFEDSDNPWIKRYFATKRYKVKNKKALAAIKWAA